MGKQTFFPVKDAKMQARQSSAVFDEFADIRVELFNAFQAVEDRIAVAVSQAPQQRKQEIRVVTAEDVTAGFFLLQEIPAVPETVTIHVGGGSVQINKAVEIVGDTEDLPDFVVLNDNQMHINNNGDATGLGGGIVEGQLLVIVYDS